MGGLNQNEICCGVEEIHIINMEDGAEQIKTLANLVQMEDETIILEPNRYVWISIDSVNRVTGEKRVGDLAIYPTGSLEEDILRYAIRTMHLSFKLMNLLEEQNPRMKFTKEDVEPVGVQLDIPVLISILLTKLYEQDNQTILTMAQTILCRLYKAHFTSEL